jgi:LPXTG-site transpeptidase (sortase) family protein
MSGIVLVTTAVLATSESWSSAPLPSVGDRESALAAYSASPMPAMPSAQSSEPAEQPAPVRVKIPDLGIDAKVFPVGVTADQALEIPEDISEVGWFKYGPAPGSSQGSSVLVAHRDGTSEGRGVFFPLDSVDEGTKVNVVTESGSVVRYRVVSVEGIQKSTFDTEIEEFFTGSGKPRLTLITCGGAYEEDNGGYQANVVVTAVPVA